MTSPGNVNLPSIQMLLSNINEQPAPVAVAPAQTHAYGNVYNTPPGSNGAHHGQTPVYREVYTPANVSYETPLPQYHQPYTVAMNGYVSPIMGPNTGNMDSMRSAHILKSLSVQPQEVPRYTNQAFVQVTSGPAQVQMYPQQQLPTPLLQKVAPVPYYEHTHRTLGELAPAGYPVEMTRITPASPSSTSSNASGSNSNSTVADKIPKKCVCKKSPGSAEHIPRPRNAFILFRQHLHYSIFPKDRYMLVTQGSFKTNSEVSREIGKRWRELPADEKKYWQDLALKEKEMHKQKYPDYKYAPRKLVESSDSNSDSDENGGHHTKQRRRQREPCVYCKLRLKAARKDHNTKL
ncbi:hypothetical protein DAKH74_028670 [Maudiozyma humilis]|uniref:HMG box domain-containing protein n=1 Tax=Maudiozyma humilis TaxID=51915 RepID=A0AAV5RXW0_MAUHU|nr:hypothetical protein DAKH74_028670 [Kazachstania humilis]